MIEIKELLPIGSVIWLKDAEHALMIFGVKQRDMESGIEYDYIGVLYPEGNMGTEVQFLFQHKDIDKVLFKGYETEDRKEFLKRLEDFYQNAEKKDE